VSARAVESPPPARWSEVIAACTAGARAGALRESGALVTGVGRGIEPMPDDAALAPDTVIAIEVADDHCVRQDIARITDAGAVLLTD
jgi:hypothetical protein